MHFYSLGTHGKKNMGRPGGASLGLWGSNRGQQRPVGT